MTPALKTPETIARIRACAPTRSMSEIARDLGWDVNRLQRTAREFRIELCGDAIPSVVSAPPPPTPTPAPEPDHAVSPSPPESDRASGPRLKLHLMNLDEMIAALPRRQSNVLSILRNAIVERRALNANEIAGRMHYGSNAQTIINSINILRTKLRGSRWAIESSKGPGGGFRLMNEGDEP